MTTQQYNLKAVNREIFGKKTKRLRVMGQVPANISGKIKEPVAITVEAKAFSKIYQDAGETAVVYLQVGEEKQTRPTLVDSVEYNPLTKKLVHVSFRQVSLKEKVSAAVPVELIGELSVKDASVNLMHEEIEVEALPTDFPEAFEIDLALFTEIGQEFTVKELKADPEKLTLSLEPDEVLVQIQEVQQMAEEPVEAPAEEAAESVAAAEGEKPAAEQTATSDAAQADEKKE